MTKKLTIEQQRKELAKRLNGRNLHDAIIETCGSLVKQGKDKEEISQWLEEKFGVSLWSIADMKPETLKEILDKKEK
jgi:hypothetical protein